MSDSQLYGRTPWAKLARTISRIMTTAAELQQSFVMAALDRYEVPLTRYALRLLGNHQAEARDAVQHTFLKLCEQSPDDMESRLGPWLYSVCRNRIIDVIRKRSNEPAAEQHVGQVNGRERDPAEWAETADLHGLVQKFVKDLPASEREVVELWCQGFSNREMASIVGKSQGAIRVALHRAIKQIRSRPQIAQWLNSNESQNRTNRVRA